MSNAIAERALTEGKFAEVLNAASALPEAERRHFFISVDEFQNFTTLSVANMVSELRKYGVGLVLAHQHLHQLGR